MSAVQTITWQPIRATDGIGPINESVQVPSGKVRRGRSGTDRALSKLLCEALDDLSQSDCSFWACEGPNKPKHMATCVKCWAMRNIADVRATLDARYPTNGANHAHD